MRSLLSRKEEMRVEKAYVFSEEKKGHPNYRIASLQYEVGIKIICLPNLCFELNSDS